MCVKLVSRFLRVQMLPAAAPAASGGGGERRWRWGAGSAAIAAQCLAWRPSFCSGVIQAERTMAEVCQDAQGLRVSATLAGSRACDL